MGLADVIWNGLMVRRAAHRSWEAEADWIYGATPELIYEEVA